MEKDQKNLSEEETKKLQEEKEYQEKVDKKLLEELQKNSAPFCLSKAFVNKPCLVLSICFVIFVICIILTGVGNLGEMSKNHDRDYLIWSNERTEHFDMLKEAQDQFMKGQQNTIIPLQSIPNDKWMTFIVLQREDEDESVLTVENIKLLDQIEQRILNLENYPKFCLATTESTACDPQNSFLSFNNYLKQAYQIDISSVTQAQIDQALSDIQSDPNLFTNFKGFFAKTFTESSKQSYIIRSIFNFGGPIEIDGKRYKDIFDEEIEQIEKFNELTKEILEIVRDEDKNDVPEGTLVLPYSLEMMNFEMQNVINTDFLFAFGSIVFVWIYMSIHLRSFFLGSMSMLSIVVSFPITLVIFKLICQIDFFSSLHVLVIFIVLGISADNVFVFTDAWNQTENYSYLGGDFNKRMAFTYRRATKAMLATSSTTGAAFLATGLSPIMPISSFGFFAGILIPVNFILVITFYPALLMIFEKYTKNMCNKNNKKTEQQQNNQQENQQKIGQEQKQNQIIEPDFPIRQNPKEEALQSYRNQAVVLAQPENETQQQNDQQEINVKEIQPSNEQQNDANKNLQQKKQDVIVKEHPVLVFFDTKFNDFVFKFRYVIMVVFAIWTGIAIWRTTLLPSLSEPEQFLPDDYDTVMAMELMRYKFTMSGNSDTGIKVYHYWGVDGLNKDDVGMWESENLGEIKWDKEFSLSPKANQQYLYDYCETMKTSDLVQDGLVNCFMVDFKNFVGAENFPVEPSQFMTKLQDFVQNDNNGKSYYNENAIGIIKGELKYVSIELSAKGVPFSPYNDLNPTYEKWNDLIKSENKKAPTGMNNGQQTAYLGWVFMITERAFSSSAVQGTLIALAFAFCVLLLTTHNIIMALYSIFSISAIVVSVITIMQLAGWELGVAESVAIVILIGLSVDYVVHLANHYVECPYPDRYRKMKVSLKDLGISIISGASTTIGSGIFLFFATIVMFNKFAILIIATILFSLAYSLIFFSALNHIAGPQGDVGNLLVLCKKKQKQEESNEKQKQDVEQK